MKRIIVIVSLFILSTVCFGQEEYRNKKWHFSLTIPAGWDIITDEYELEDYTKDMEIRFDEVGFIALLLKESQQGRNSILVQAQTIGDAERQYEVLENSLKEGLTENSYRYISQEYLNEAKMKWIEQGIAAEKQEPKGLIFYDLEKNIFYETTAFDRIDNLGAICKGTARVLGFNRVIILSFELDGRGTDEPLNFIQETAESVEFDKNYGFGEQPAKSIFKTLWVWLFPGFGALIVSFLIYKWVASEYG